MSFMDETNSRKFRMHSIFEFSIFVIGILPKLLLFQSLNIIIYLRFFYFCFNSFYSFVPLFPARFQLYVYGYRSFIVYVLLLLFPCLSVALSLLFSLSITAFLHLVRANFGMTTKRIYILIRSRSGSLTWRNI